MGQPVTAETRAVAVIVIGRNEGARLEACLRSIPGGVPVVYVDSGSTDASVAFARSMGASVVELSGDVPFTAARARNAGLAALAAGGDAPDYVQMVDGDCVLADVWLERGAAALDAEPGLVAVFGRLAERFPDRSVYNAMCDQEWDVPIGLVNACGGIAMLRREPVTAAGGYAEDLIAGEEPELCLRLRHAGWTVRRIDAAMALHDAAMTRLGQWWRRTERSGHAFAELAARHPDDGDPAWTRELKRIIGWTAGLLAVVVIAGPLLGWAWGIFLACLLVAAQVMRLTVRWRRGDRSWRIALALAGFSMLGKVPQLQGVIRYYRRRGKAPQLIEYKRPPAARA